MGISLLPDELRKKEEEEKQKVKGAMGLPQFRMHAAEKILNGAAPTSAPPAISADSVEFGASAPEASERGIFRVVEKRPIPPVGPERKVTPVPLPRPVNNRPPVLVPPAVKVERPPQPRAPERGFRMHTPEQDKQNGDAPVKKIIREAHDKVADVKVPPPLLSVIRREATKDLGKKPPAELNLIAEDYAGVVKTEFWRRIKQLAALILVFVVVGALAFAIVKWQKIEWLKKYQAVVVDIDGVEKEISGFGADSKQFDLLKNRAAALQVLFDNHVYWTAFLSQLEKITLENVRYYNLTAETNGEISLTARAKKYSDAAGQLAAFEAAEFVERADMGAVTQTPSAEAAGQPAAQEYPVEFSIKLKLKPTFLNTH